MNTKAIIFSDGASRGNPGPGGWASIVIENGNVQEKGGRDSQTTNNRMELMGAIEGLKATSLSHVTLVTDSRYLINGATKWISGWKRKGWKRGLKADEDVINQDLWKELDGVMQGKTIDWQKAEGHAGVPGNERADEIASAHADGKEPELFSGALEQYSHNILNERGEPDLQTTSKADDKRARNDRSKQKAYSYVSSVDGVIEVHQTWKECEGRVRGMKKAKFKKSLSAEDEKALIKEWTVQI